MRLRPFPPSDGRLGGGGDPWVVSEVLRGQTCSLARWTGGCSRSLAAFQGLGGNSWVTRNLSGLLWALASVCKGLAFMCPGHTRSPHVLSTLCVGSEPLCSPMLSVRGGTASVLFPREARGHMQGQLLTAVRRQSLPWPPSHPRETGMHL